MDAVAVAHTTNVNALNYPVFPDTLISPHRIPSHDFESTIAYEAYREPIYSVLLGEIAPGWEVVRPLFVMIEQDDDGGYVASDDRFVVYGAGDTASNAWQDYIVSLMDYYELVRGRAEDSIPTQALLHHLQTYLRRSD